MKIFRLLILLTGTLFLLNSCKKQEISSPLIPENYVAIFCSQYANIFNHDSSYHIFAFARFARNGRPVNTGPVRINERLISAEFNNAYHFSYTENNAFAEGQSLIGKDIQVSATGPDQFQPRTATTAIYLPKVLYPTTLFYPKSWVERGETLPLIWDPDENNQSKTVDIEISYYRGLSQSNTNGMPNEITSLVYQVVDNGSFNVPQEDLNRFPKGCFVGIYLGRQSYQRTSGNYDLVAVTSVSTGPLLVTD